MDKERKEWLASLKVGDEVAIVRTLHTPRIERVTRLTATQIVINGEKYSRDDGYEIPYKRGGGTPHIVPAAQEHRDAIERERLTTRLLVVNWRDDWPLDKLRRIVAIIEEGGAQ